MIVSKLHLPRVAYSIGNGAKVYFLESAYQDYAESGASDDFRYEKSFLEQRLLSSPITVYAIGKAEMATKELQHGRLAMLAVAGFVAQELVDGSPILETEAWSNIL